MLESKLKIQVKQNIDAKRRYTEFAESFQCLIRTELTLHEYLDTLLHQIQMLPVDKNPLIYIAEFEISQRYRELEDWKLVIDKSNAYFLYQTTQGIIEEERISKVYSKLSLKSSNYLQEILTPSEMDNENLISFEIDLFDLYVDGLFEVVETTRNIEVMDFFIELLESHSLKE